MIDQLSVELGSALWAAIADDARWVDWYADERVVDPSLPPTLRLQPDLVLREPTEYVVRAGSHWIGQGLIEGPVNGMAPRLAMAVGRCLSLVNQPAAADPRERLRDLVRELATTPIRYGRYHVEARLTAPVSDEAMDVMPTADLSFIVDHDHQALAISGMIGDEPFRTRVFGLESYTEETLPSGETVWAHIAADDVAQTYGPLPEFAASFAAVLVEALDVPGVTLRDEPDLALVDGSAVSVIRLTADGPAALTALFPILGLTAEPAEIAEIVVGSVEVLVWVDLATGRLRGGVTHLPIDGVGVYFSRWTLFAENVPVVIERPGE